MLIKKLGVMLFGIILLSSMIIAQDYKLDVSTNKETYSAGENVTISVYLLDSNNNPIEDNVDLTITNAEKTKEIKKTIQANKFQEIDLGIDAGFGYWEIVADYEDSQGKALFIVEVKEEVKFELKDGNLIVTNTGNTPYTKTIQIVIGETIGARTPSLAVGESIKYKLVAPEGVYDIKVTDGKTTIEKNSVGLTGTGNAIGAIDESEKSKGAITGGISPSEENDQAFLSYIGKSKSIYIFIVAIFGAMILIAIERRTLRK